MPITFAPLSRPVLAVVALLALATPSQAAAQELVTNGGFETGDFSGWTQFGQTDFSGASPFAPYVGDFAYEFGQVGGTGGIFQWLATTPGTTYTLSFWLMNEGTEPPNLFDVAWNGTSVLNLTDVPDFGYTFFSYDVMATAVSTELRFTARNDDFYWDLDEVSVSAPGEVVPEPATMTLLATGLLGLAGTRRRRSRS
jgi:hypothetical protein